MNKIIYISSLCSNETMSKYFEGKQNLFPHQSQKYNSLLVRGLLENNQKVRVLSIPPVNRNVSSRLFITKDKGIIHGSPYQTISFINIKIIKNIIIFFNIFFKLLFSRSNIIVIDLLNKSAVLSVYISSFIRKRYVVGILTDLPNFRTDKLNNYDKLTNVANVIYNRFDHYILLTEEMALLHPKFRNHYIIIEGISDIVNVVTQSSRLEIKTCMYTGTLAKIYGISHLIEAFKTLELSHIDLIIYGDGDYKREIIKATKTYSNIIYKGSVSNSEIVEEQKKVHLLINPRPNSGSYVKYSFPSKIMEYMSSGTPLLSVNLPGIPNEYKKYINLIDECNPDSLKNAILKILGEDYRDYLYKADLARNFVANNKNSQFQAARVLKVLDNEVRNG